MLTKVLIVIVVAFVALTAARPGYLHGHHHHHLDYPFLHHHHEPLHVAKYVHIPAAISHQSSTVIHSPPILKPVVVPVVKHVVKAYHPAPIIHPAPLHYDPFYHHHFDHHDFHHDLHHFH